MLNDEICKLRDKLNNSIASGEDYSVIYKLSIELDELIAEYYRRKKERSRLMVCQQGRSVLTQNNIWCK